MPLNPKAKFELVAEDKTAIALRSAQTRLERFSRETSTLLKGAFGIFAAGALVRGIVASAKALEEVDRQAKSLGASVEAIQELTLTFREFGLDSNDVADALGTLADRAKDAEDGTRSFIDDFRLLGVEVEDLRNKRPEELLRLVAERVAQIEDPTRRTAGVVRIFGDDLGRRLNPLLIKGAEGLAQYADRWHDLGRIIDEEGVTAGAKAARTFRDLREQINAEFTQQVADNAEAVSILAEAMTTLATNTASAATVIGEGLGIALAQALTGIRDPNDQLGTLIDRIDNTKDSLGELRQELQNMQQFGFAGPQIQRTFDEIADQEALLRRLQEARQLLESGRDPGFVPAPDTKQATEAAANAGTDAGRAFVERFRFQVDLGLDEPFKADRLLPQLTADQAFPVTKIVDPAFKELANRAIDTRDNIDDAYQSLARSIGSSLHRSFSDAFLGIETDFGGMLRRMASDLLASALLKGLGTLIPGPIGSFLKTEDLPGFKDGGTFTVGGSGGPDSQLVAFRATPGEPVRVGGPALAGGGGVTINIQQHIQAGLPPQWHAQLANATSLAAAVAKESIARDIAGRR